MVSKLPLLLLFVPFCVFAQQVPKQMLRGLVVSHPVQPDSVLIVNKTKNRYVYSCKDDNFSIMAAVSDTVVFSAMNYKEEAIVVTAKNLAELIVVRIESYANPLNEVIINRYLLTGDLATDSKNIIVEEDFKIDVDFSNLPAPELGDPPSGPISNSAMPQSQSTLSGINFLLIGSYITDWMGIKAKPEKSQKKDFIDIVRNRFSDEQIATITGIADDQLMLYLNYCDANQPSETDLLLDENQLDLMEYLLAKAEEFRKL